MRAFACIACRTGANFVQMGVVPHGRADGTTEKVDDRAITITTTLGYLVQTFEVRLSRHFRARTADKVVVTWGN